MLFFFRAGFILLLPRRQLQPTGGRDSPAFFDEAQGLRLLTDVYLEPPLKNCVILFFHSTVQGISFDLVQIETGIFQLHRRVHFPFPSLLPVALVVPDLVLFSGNSAKPYCSPAPALSRVSVDDGAS